MRRGPSFSRGWPRGIFLLQDLFRGELGSTIPQPGPFACSPDPTGDALDCADPGGCL